MDRDLTAFLAVARTGSLTAAAAALNIAQPTLTKRLQKLERHHRCRLFQREARGAVLTAFGRRLLPHAQRIEAQYLQAAEALAAERSPHLPVLRIGAGPLFHLLHLSGALVRLRQDYPETRFELTTGLNHRTLPMLRDGILDLVFGANEGSDPGDQLAFTAMASVEQGVVIREGHPLRRRLGPACVRAADLCALPWIVYGETEDDTAITTGFFSREGMPPPEFVLRTSSFTLGLQAVARSDCAMTLPIELAPFFADRPLATLRTSPPMAILDVGAFARPTSLSYPVVERLVELVGASIDAAVSG